MFKECQKKVLDQKTFWSSTFCAEDGDQHNAGHECVSQDVTFLAFIFTSDHRRSTARKVNTFHTASFFYSTITSPDSVTRG